MYTELEKKIESAHSNFLNPPSPKKENLKNIIIADLGEWTGHRPNYLKTIIQLFSEANRKMFVISSNRAAVQEFINAQKIPNTTVLEVRFSSYEKIIFKGLRLIDKLISSLKLNTWFEPQSIVQLLQIKYLQRQNNLSDTLVFFTSVSDLMPIVPIGIRSYLFPKFWSGIYVTPWYNTGNIFTKSAKRKRAYGNRSMALPSCRGIFVIHQDYTRYYRRLLGKDHFLAIPEPISLKVNQEFKLAQKIREAANGRFIITLLGAIGKKRNLPLLLNALNLMSNKNFFLVIIGKLQEKDFSQNELVLIKNFFKKYKDQCFIKLDGYVTVEADFNALIASTDLMYLHYHNHPFSSNQLLKSIALRKPVIVNHGGMVEAIVKEAKWSAITVPDSEQIAIDIEKIQRQFMIDEAAYAQFMQALDYKNLRNIIINQLENTKLSE